jgi:hypothetical protein
VIGFAFTETKRLWKPGFLSVYKGALGEILNTDWADCPVDFDVIEQVVLARNRAQHGGYLTSLQVMHDEETLKKHPKPFFVSDDEFRSLEQGDGSLSVFLSPEITINRDNLFAAIAEIDKLADWIDGRGDQIYEWRMKRR